MPLQILPANNRFFLIAYFVTTLPAFMSAQWTALHSGTGETLYEIVFPSTDTGYVVGTNGTLLRTFDGGDQWTALDLGSGQHLHDVYFLDSQIGYVVGDSGLFSMTMDAGDQWITSYIASSTSIVLSSVCFTSPHTGYVGGRRDDLTGVIFKTIDGGSTWAETITPETFLDIDYKRIVFPVPDTGYALTRGMCMKTTDGGDHWYVTDSSLVASGDMFSLLEDACFFSADTGYIVGWYNGFCGYTINGGEQWTDQLVSHNQWYAIDFPTRQTGYLVGWGQFIKTDDGGHTWTDQTSELILTGSIYSMDFTDEETGYMCGAGGLILKTTNGGTTQIQEPDITSKLVVAPNPSNGMVQINIAGVVEEIVAFASVTVYSGLGQKVWESTDLTIPASIQMRDFPKGIYLLVARTENVQYVQRIILY